MSNKQWPNMAMVGYIDCSATGAVNEITKAQIQSYNVIIFGFANADGTIPNSGLFKDLAKTVATIKKIQSPGTVNLLSVGGAVREGDLGKVDIISPYAVEKTVSNLVASIATLQLDGIDLDIEDATISIVDILNFSRLLRTELDKTNAFLTCAPILAGSNELPELITPRGPSWAEVYGPNGVVFLSLIHISEPTRPY